MKPHTIANILCFLAALFHFSCYRIKTEANSLPQGYSVAQLVGTWKVTAVSSDKPYDWDGNGVAETNVYSTWKDCQKDNLYQFTDPYTGIFKITCSDTKPITWYLSGTTIVWTSNGQSAQSENIVTLTSNSFQTKSSLHIPNTQGFLITKVWTRQ